ncbi:MAG: hypothetical protein PHE24_00905 [Patescibacteria group bacterium]|nr:hypothetical protein [Patescibacteria group bacterium]
MATKALSAGQQREIISRIVGQVDWDSLDGEYLQKKVISLPPKEFGRQFTDFLRYGCQFIFNNPRPKELALVDSYIFQDKNWKVWKGPVDGDGLSGEEDIDWRSLAIDKIEAHKLIIADCLLEGEKVIAAEEIRLRLRKSKILIPLGFKAFQYLWLDYQADRGGSILEWLYRTKGIRHLNFMGTIFYTNHSGGIGSGSRIMPYFLRQPDYYSGLWEVSDEWMGCDFGSDRPTACYQA